MDCTICFEQIDERTGSANLSCGHIFHFGCLARWMLKNETCPYCRHEANTYETIANDECEDDATESDAESQSIEREHSLRWIRVGPGHWRIFENAIAEIPDYDEEAHALWVFRNFFEALENTNTLEVVSEKKEPHIPYSDLVIRHCIVYDVANDRGYDSA